MTEHNKESRNDSKASNKKRDDALWKAVTEDVTPLKNKNTVYKSKASTRPPKKSAHQEQKIQPASCSSLTKAGNTVENAPISPNGTDYRTKQRLKRGKMPIDGKLDLHGKTQNEAYDALFEYIPEAYNAGKRCILVITGKGLPRYGDPSLLEYSEHVGILKQKTPHWLNTKPLSQYILDIQPARPNHGGEGALYVLLKRKR